MSQRWQSSEDKLLYIRAGCLYGSVKR